MIIANITQNTGSFIFLISFILVPTLLAEQAVSYIALDCVGVRGGVAESTGARVMDKLLVVTILLAGGKQRLI